MFAFSLLSFFLNVIFIISSWYEEAGAVSYLPLTLIERKNDTDFVYPNKLKNISFEPNRGFTGNTSFAWNEYEKQLFFCPADEKQNKKYIMGSHFVILLGNYYSNHAVAKQCLFEKKFKPKDVLKCEEEPSPSIYKAEVGWYLSPNGFINMTNHNTKCGPNNKGVLFKFAYDICIPRSRLDRFKSLFDSTKEAPVRDFAAKMKFIFMAQTVYEICFNMYDREKEETFYTKHELSTIRLLKDPYLQYERDKEKQEDVLSDKIYNQDFKLKNYINFLNNLPEPYKKKQLVSPDDRMTALLRKPTFHYINIKPMHESLIDLWNYIGDYLRDHLPETEIPYEIYTGAFKISEQSKKTKIPDFWIKVIYLRSQQADKFSQSLSIVLRNEYEKDKKYEDSVMQEFCVQNDCEFLQKDENVKQFWHLNQHLRCCAVESKISSLFNVSFNKGVLLRFVKLENENDKMALKGSFD